MPVEEFSANGILGIGLAAAKGCTGTVELNWLVLGGIEYDILGAERVMVLSDSQVMDEEAFAAKWASVSLGPAKF